MPMTRRLSLGASRIWASVEGSLALILLPPFVLLIVGYVFAWVAGGFRKTA